MHENRRLTLRSVAEQANIDRETKILSEELDMTKMCTKMVPNELSMGEFLASEQITVLEHPIYSPDLGFSDFSVPEDKGRHFDDIDDIRSSTMAALEGHSTKPVPKLF
jgi:hypothetical protein